MTAAPPEFPLEELRLFVQAFIKWAMWKPPGEAVSGTFELEDFEQPKKE